MEWRDRGEAYSGQWKHDKPHGVGTQVWSSPAGASSAPGGSGGGGVLPLVNRYEGEFKHGLRHGLGTFWYADGGHYFGLWWHGHKHGAGVLTTHDGRVIQGTFTRDVLPAASGLSITTGRSAAGEAAAASGRGLKRLGLDASRAALTGTVSQPLAPSMGLHVGDLLPNPTTQRGAAGEHTRALNSVLMKWNSHLRRLYAAYTQVNSRTGQALAAAQGVLPGTGHALLGLPGAGGDAVLHPQCMQLGDLWTLVLDAGLVRPPLTLAFVDTVLHLVRMRHAVCLAGGAAEVQKGRAARAARGVSTPPTSPAVRLSGTLSAVSPGGTRASVGHRGGDVVDGKRVVDGAPVSPLPVGPGDESKGEEGGWGTAPVQRTGWATSSDSSDVSDDETWDAAAAAAPRAAAPTPALRPTSAARLRQTAAEARRHRPLIAEEAAQAGSRRDAFATLLSCRRHDPAEPVLFREFVEVLVRLAALTAGGIGGAAFALLADEAGTALGDDAGDTPRAGTTEGPAAGREGPEHAAGAPEGDALPPMPSMLASTWGGGSSLAAGDGLGVGSVSVSLSQRAAGAGGHASSLQYPGAGGWGATGQGLSLARFGLSAGQASTTLRQGSTLRQPPEAALPPPLGSQHLTGSQASAAALSQRGGGGDVVPAIRSHFDALAPGTTSLADAVDRFMLALGEPLLEAEAARAAAREASLSHGVAPTAPASPVSPASARDGRVPGTSAAPHSPLRSRALSAPPGGLPGSPGVPGGPWREAGAQGADMGGEVGRWDGPRPHQATGLRLHLRQPAVVAVHAGLCAQLQALFLKYATPDATLPLMPGSADADAALLGSIGAGSGAEGEVPAPPPAAGSCTVTAWDVARCLADARLLDTHFSAAHVAWLCAAAAFGEGAVAEAQPLPGADLWSDPQSGAGRPTSPGSFVGALPLDDLAEGGGSEGDEEEEDDAGPDDTVTGLSEGKADETQLGGGAGAGVDSGRSEDHTALVVDTESLGALDDLGVSLPVAEVLAQSDEEDERGASSEASGLANAVGDTALACKPPTTAPDGWAGLGLPLVFPQFLEALARVCLAQYAVAPLRQADAAALAEHHQALASARQAAEAAAAAAEAAAAAAAAAPKKGAGKKKKSAAVLAAEEEAASAAASLDTAAQRGPPPTPPAAVELLPPQAPLAAKLEHFLLHTLLRRHKIGGHDEASESVSVRVEATVDSHARPG